MRFFIELAYDGSDYHGWQIQKNASSVQETLNTALSTILRKDVQVTGSGRTDTGVHASKQVAHFDYHESLGADMCHRLNNLLPASIAIHEIKQVNEEASARFDATSRSYIYKINRFKDPFSVKGSYFYNRPIDTSAMNECGELMKSWTDYECFSKVHTDVNTFECTIHEAVWRETNNGLDFYVTANRFLRGMVRAIVGTMLLVGEGKLDIEGFKAILVSRDRKKAGRSVPAHGLYLSEVIYPEEIYL